MTERKRSRSSDPPAAAGTGVPSGVPTPLAARRRCSTSGGGWAARPAAVVCIPSRNRPRLVAGLGERIAMIGRIPSVHTIAEHHHVSHRVAARALEILKGEGMVVSRPGEGDFVRHPREA